MVTSGTAAAAVSTALTTLPRLSATEPVRPVMGARMVVKLRLTRALSSVASLARTVASETATLVVTSSSFCADATPRLFSSVWRVTSSR